MSSLRFFRNKIKSIGSTKKITKSMQLVAGTKLQKVEKLAKSENLLYKVLHEIISNLIFSQDISSKKKKDIFLGFKYLLNKTQLLNLPKLLIVLTSEKGLCGSFNQVIMKNLHSDIDALEANNQKYWIIILGKKGFEILDKNYHSKVIQYWNRHKHNSYVMDTIISEFVFSLFLQNRISSASLYFYKYKNTLVQNFAKMGILDFSIQEVSNKKTNFEEKFYLYEGKTLFKSLLRQYIASSIKYSLIQNTACEEAIRRMVMENAFDNASEIEDNLYLAMNKKRQAVITTELTEIISGLSALE